MELQTSMVNVEIHPKSERPSIASRYWIKMKEELRLSYDPKIHPILDLYLVSPYHVPDAYRTTNLCIFKHHASQRVYPSQRLMTKRHITLDHHG